MAAKETLLTIRSTMKVPQRKRQISKTGERTGKGIGERRGYMYHHRNEAKIPTLTPTAVDTNTLPTHPQVKGRTTEENRRWENGGPLGLMAGMAVARWPRSPY